MEYGRSDTLKNYTYEMVQAETRYKDLFGTEEFKEMRSRDYAYCKPYLEFIEDDIRCKLTEE